MHSVQVRLAAIKALELPAGAQACIALPIEGMRDIRNKKHSWNVIQKQYGKYNENNTLEDTPEGTCMCVKYPAGAPPSSLSLLMHALHACLNVLSSHIALKKVTKAFAVIGNICYTFFI